MKDAYQRGYTAGQKSTEVPISKPVKEQLRKQVDATAKTFQAEQPILLEQALKDPNYLFIIDVPISVTAAGNQACSLTGGDIIKPAEQDVLNTEVAKMVVVTSKTDTCPARSPITVSLTDLQEMLNSFGEKVDDGMNELQKQHSEAGKAAAS